MKSGDSSRSVTDSTPPPDISGTHEPCFYPCNLHTYIYVKIMTTKNTALNVERYKTIRLTSDHSDSRHVSEILDEIRESQELAKIIEKIKTAKTKDDKDDIKREELPVFKPCVTVPCHQPYETNGIIQLDVDVYDIDKSRQLKQLMIEIIPSLLYAFISPKGGLKIAILSDLVGEDEDAYEEAYNLAVDHIGALLGACPRITT